MKTTFYLLLVVIYSVLIGCKTTTQETPGNFALEIHETVMRNQLPDTLLTAYQDTDKVIPDNLPEPVIAYIDSLGIKQLSIKPKPDSLLFVASIFTVDSEQKNYLLVAIKKTAALTMADIKRTKAIQNRVEIFFTLEGARKWANLTQVHLGKHVAIVINSRVYELPLISGEIKNGVAMISNLPSPELAVELSAGINAGLPR